MPQCVAVARTPSHQSHVRQHRPTRRRPLPPTSRHHWDHRNPHNEAQSSADLHTCDLQIEPRVQPIMNTAAASPPRNSRIEPHAIRLLLLPSVTPVISAVLLCCSSTIFISEHRPLCFMPITADRVSRQGNAIGRVRLGSCIVASLLISVECRTVSNAFEKSKAKTRTYSLVESILRTAVVEPVGRKAY